MRLSGDFSTETLKARRDWHKIFKVRKIYNQDYSTKQVFFFLEFIFIY